MTTTQKIDLSREIRQWIAVVAPLAVAGIYILGVAKDGNMDQDKLREMRYTINGISSHLQLGNLISRIL